MNHIPPWLKVAESIARRGVLEVPGGQHNSDILDFGRAVDLAVTTDEIPWCSNFVNYCFMQCDIERTRSAAARSWLKWGVRLPLEYPALGAVCVMKRGGGNQPGRDVIRAKAHVGFFIGRPSPWEVTVLSGNQNNSVCERNYPIGLVIDYRWPAEEKTA